MAMGQAVWPERWQEAAIQAAAPYLDTDERLDNLIGDPARSASGTRIAGHLYRADDGRVMGIYDHSGRSGIYPWPLLNGTVFVIKLLRPHRPAKELFRHPLWPKRP